VVDRPQKLSKVFRGSWPAFRALATLRGLSEAWRKNDERENNNCSPKGRGTSIENMLVLYSLGQKANHFQKPED